MLGRCTMNCDALNRAIQPMSVRDCIGSDMLGDGGGGGR